MVSGIADASSLPPAPVMGRARLKKLDHDCQRFCHPLYVALFLTKSPRSASPKIVPLHAVCNPSGVAQMQKTYLAS
jgi:hypothetical protein